MAKNLIQNLLPFHELFFIPVEVTEKNACYCCRILKEQERVCEKLFGFLLATSTSFNELEDQWL